MTLAIALWGICLPVFIRHYIDIQHIYKTSIARLKDINDARETINQFETCRQKKNEYPQKDGYRVNSWIDSDGLKHELLFFTWKENKIIYELR